jgi:hypothetical protein
MMVSAALLVKITTEKKKIGGGYSTSEYLVSASAARPASHPKLQTVFLKEISDVRIAPVPSTEGCESGVAIRVAWLPLLLQPQ